MIYLIQILHTLNIKDIKLFEVLFSDIQYDVKDLGYEGSETELVEDLLLNHFGIEMEDEFQLRLLTTAVLQKTHVKTACSLVTAKKAA